MASTVIATCRSCRTTWRIPPGSVLVDADGHTACWICLACASLVEKAVDATIEASLLEAGAWELRTAYEAPPHPEPAPAGPALTPDDLLDFQRLLADDSVAPVERVLRLRPEGDR